MQIEYSLNTFAKNISLNLNNLYDSHVHWLSTGDSVLNLSLRNLKSTFEIGNLKILPHHFRGDWLCGYSWDENKLSDPENFNRTTLDRFFPHFPVLFIRTDGHSSCLNTLGLKLLGWCDSNGKVTSEINPALLPRDAHGYATGIAKENLHMVGVLNLKPFTSNQLKERLLTGQNEFHKGGFCFIRDMAMTEELWNVCYSLDQTNELKMQVECQFTCEDKNDFMRALNAAIKLKKAETSRLKVSGIKFYFDGSLGSDTALHKKSEAAVVGTQLWTEEDTYFAINAAWKNNLEISIHALGDEAVHRIALIARNLSATGMLGILNIEHAEVLRPETIKLLKSLHVRCHLQPCHYLTDKMWLKDKLGKQITRAFPWEALRLNKIPFSFGSDSPIESPSLINNLFALQLSAESNIPLLGDDPLKYHIYPHETSNRSNCFFDAGTLRKLIFNNEIIIDQ